MDKKYLHCLFLHFLRELDNEIVERYPGLAPADRQVFAELVLDKLLVAPVQAVGSVSDLRDQIEKQKRKKQKERNKKEKNKKERNKKEKNKKERKNLKSNRIKKERMK